MMMSYTKIANNGKVVIRVPAISFLANKSLRLNASATKRFHDEGVSRVLLHLDRKRKRVALSVAAESDGQAYAVSYSKRQNSADIGARALFNEPEVKDKRGASVLIWNQEQKMFEALIPHN